MSLSGCIDKVVGLGATATWATVTFASTTATDVALLASMAEPITGLVVAGTTLAKHFHDVGREDCAKAVLRVRRKVEADIEAWIEVERIDRREIDRALAEFDARLKEIAPSGRELAADSLDPDLVARRLIKRLPSLDGLPDSAPARRVITTIVTTSFKLILADDALYRRIEPAVMAEVLRRFTGLDQRITVLDETFRRLFVEAETAAQRRHVEAMATQARNHAESMASHEKTRQETEKTRQETEKTRQETEKLRLEIARQKGVDPIHLKPLFDAVGADPNIPPDQFEAAIRAAVETLLARARDPVAPSNDGAAVDAAIAVAREMLSRLDTDGAVNSLRAARQRQADARQHLARGEARLAEEEGDILAAAYRRDEVIEAYRAAIELDPDRLEAYRKIGRTCATVGRRAEALTAFERFHMAAERLANEREVHVAKIEIGDMRAAEGDRAGALEAYHQALEIAKTLAARDPAHAGWQRDLSVSWNKIGDLRAAEGDRASALEAYGQTLEIAKTLAARDPARAEWQSDLSVSWERIGDMRAAEGDRAGAIEAYGHALEIRKTLAARDPANTKWQRDLSISWNKIGDMRAAQGDRAGALDAYGQALEIRMTLAARDPAHAGCRRDLSVSWNKIGNLRAAQGDRAGALDAYGQALEIRMTLAARDPANAGWRRDLSVSWNKIGNLRAAEGDRAGALEAYGQALEIAKTLAARDPANAEWQRGLSVSWERIGDMRAAEGDCAGAIEAYGQALEIRKTLAARDPANAEWQRDLVASWERIGTLRAAEGDRKGALAAFAQALEIAKTLAARDPANAGWQRDLIISNVKLAEMGDDALGRYTEALRIAQELQASGRLAPVDAWMIEDLGKRRSAARP